jgi:hypothetical protein
MMHVVSTGNTIVKLMVISGVGVSVPFDTVAHGTLKRAGFSCKRSSIMMTAAAHAVLSRTFRHLQQCYKE